jgi:hypothetical protein
VFEFKNLAFLRLSHICYARNFINNPFSCNFTSLVLSSYITICYLKFNKTHFVISHLILVCRNWAESYQLLRLKLPLDGVSVRNQHNLTIVNISDQFSLSLVNKSINNGDVRKY